MKHKEVVAKFIIEHGVKIFAEIGIWKSHTVRQVLRDKKCNALIEQYWGVDQFKLVGAGHGRSSKRTQYQWDSMYNYACNLMTWFPQFRIIRMDSVDLALLFREQKYFDFVFIDADHSYEGAKRDIKAWLPLIKENGWIGGHDYLVSRKVNKGVKKAVNEIFGKDIQTLDAGNKDEIWVVQT